MAEAEANGVVKATGRVAEGIVGGLAAQPTLLLIAILNIVMILTAGYYLLRQEELRNKNQEQVVGLIRSCILETEIKEKNYVP